MWCVVTSRYVQCISQDIWTVYGAFCVMWGCIYMLLSLCSAEIAKAMGDINCFSLIFTGNALCATVAEILLQIVQAEHLQQTVRERFWWYFFHQANLTAIVFFFTAAKLCCCPATRVPPDDVTAPLLEDIEEVDVVDSKSAPLSVN